MSLIKTLTAAWRRVFGPAAPVDPGRQRRIARRFACAGCGRVVAHTGTGRPYLHNCRPVNLLPVTPVVEHETERAS